MRYFFLLLVLPLLAEEEPYTPDLTITSHTLQLESGPLSYTAITGMCPIFNENKLEAELFFISYIKDTKENRPITFIFPGGPGAAGTLDSIITFGPKRLLTTEEGRSQLPPYKLIDNPQTLLEHTDLVFVDPVGCGFSKTQEEVPTCYYYSVEGDIQTLGEFIHTYIDMSHRWNSPIYLGGTSYGTLRCCGLAKNLLQYGIGLNGLILEGCAFEWATISGQRDHSLPDCLIIPTFAATAWYHKRLWPNQPLDVVIDYARRFAYEEYAPYMLQPSRISHVEKVQLEKKLAELVGLPVETVRRYNGRIDESIYTAEFFGSERKVLGGLDTRYTDDIASIDPKDAHDPSYKDAFLGTLPAFLHYLQSELETYLPLTKYISFSEEAFSNWYRRTTDSRGQVSFLQRLRHAMITNPQMKIFVGSGYYDCRTPFAATEYSFEHLDLPESYKKNIRFEYYEAGHGSVFDYPSLKKWKKDLSGFYAN
jgi:carboxypeptidase C (cathepsin A)